MKLNNREKILLGVLALFALLYLCYQFVYIPQQERLASVQEENDNKKNELLSLDLNSEKTLDEKILNEKKELINLSGDIFGYVDQEDIIFVLNKFWTKNNIVTKAVTFSEPEPFSNTDESEPDAENEEIPQKASIQVNFECDYPSIIQFLHDIDTYERQLAVDNFTLHYKENILTGNMVINCYYFPYLDKHKAPNVSMFKDDLIDKSVNSNPFRFGTECTTKNIDLNISTDTKKEVVQNSDGTSKSYTVQSGDTIFQISYDLFGNYDKVRQIIEYNNLKNPSLILPGEQLRIPDETTSNAENKRE